MPSCSGPRCSFRGSLCEGAFSARPRWCATRAKVTGSSGPPPLRQTALGVRDDNRSCIPDEDHFRQVETSDAGLRPIAALMMVANSRAATSSTPPVARRSPSRPSNVVAARTEGLDCSNARIATSCSEGVHHPLQPATRSQGERAGLWAALDAGVGCPRGIPHCRRCTALSVCYSHFQDWEGGTDAPLRVVPPIHYHSGAVGGAVSRAGRGLE